VGDIGLAVCERRRSKKGYDTVQASEERRVGDIPSGHVSQTRNIQALQLLTCSL
jgi:hypothetical protein